MQNIQENTSNNEIIYGEILKFPIKSSRSRSEKVIETQYTRITRDDLSRMNNIHGGFNNTDHNKNRFTYEFRSYPRRPKGVFINHMRFGAGTNPNPRYNWWAEKRFKGTAKVVEKKVFTQWKDVSGAKVHVERNYSNSVLIIPRAQRTQINMKTTTSWSVKRTNSMSVTVEVNLPLDVGSVSTTVGVALERGEGGSKSEEIQEKPWTPEIHVPVGYEAVFVLQERWQDKKTEWQVPMEIRGLVGADFGENRYNGHHFYGISAYEFFDEYKYLIPHSKRYVINVSEQKRHEFVYKAYLRPRSDF